MSRMRSVVTLASGSGVLVGAGFVLATVILLVVVLTIPMLQSDDTSAGSGSTGCVDPAVDTGATVPAEYQEVISTASTDAGIDAAVLAAQIEQESNWDPQAESHAGAQGIAQFMPATWKEWGSGDVFDPQAAIKAQGEYMGHLMSQVSDLADSQQQQVKLALASYNAGFGTVQAADGIPRIVETQNYVRDITRAADAFRNSEGSSQAAGPAESNTQPTVQRASSTSGESDPSNCADVQQVLASLSDGDWVTPLPGGTVTSTFGPRACPAGVECNKYTTHHYGLDLSAGGGAQIVAPTKMKITETGSNQHQGEYVVAQQVSDPGLFFEFHHCQSGSTQASVDQTLETADSVCLEGTTGNSSGAHLHFGITSAETPTDASMVERYDYAVAPTPILEKMGAL